MAVSTEQPRGLKTWMEVQEPAGCFIPAARTDTQPRWMPGSDSVGADDEIPVTTIALGVSGYHRRG